MSTELEGKGTPYANRLGEFAGAAMQDMHRYRKALWDIEELLSELYEADARGRYIGERTYENFEKRVFKTLLLCGEALRYYEPPNRRNA